MKILLLDNYDSFTYNLAQYLGELGHAPDVRRNDQIAMGDVEAMRPDRIVISPGPGRPEDAGISVEVIRRMGERVPVLGVCLGHQAMATAYGGRFMRGEPIHGKTAEVEHDGRGVFRGLASPITAGRYHSLIVHPDLPDVLERSAWMGDTVMAIRHRDLPAEGVQFHPESVLTADGKALLRNFLDD